MTNPDELEKATERVARWANYEWTTADQIAVKSELSTFTAGDLRLILSANREMRGALERIAHPEYGIGFNRLRGIARSALTTQRGDGK